jgi:site-specific DNA-adenine methylase
VGAAQAVGGGVMFSYYGSKSKVVHLYPKPKFDKIIEPFAGSARYSLKYFDRDVLLVDKYEVIVKIWKYLQAASPADIMGLPEPKPGEDVRKYKFDCEEAQMLTRFMVGGGLSWMQWVVSPQGFGAGVAMQKKNIAKSLFKIKHWKIQMGDYAGIPNEKATWFIDPPYQFGGHKYPQGNKNINFKFLADWCKSREGQIIVCENTKATWLPFYAMHEMTGAYSTTTEAIWSNYPHNFQARQASLFEMQP